MDTSPIRDIMDFLRDLAREDCLRVTAFESAKGGVIAGVGATVGGMVLGPIGLFAGGAVGGLIAAATCNEFTPVHQIIAEMPEHHRERLATQVRGIMNRHQVTTVAALAALMAGGGVVRNELIGELTRYLRDEMQYALA